MDVIREDYSGDIHLLHESVGNVEEKAKHLTRKMVQKGRRQRLDDLGQGSNNQGINNIWPCTIRGMKYQHF